MRKRVAKIRHEIGMIFEGKNEIAIYIGSCKNCCRGTIFCHSAQSTLTYVLVLTRPYPQRFGTSKNPLFRGSDHSAENRGNDRLVWEAF